MMRRTIAALAASKQSGPYRAKLKPPAMPVVMTSLKFRIATHCVSN